MTTGDTGIRFARKPRREPAFGCFSWWRTFGWMIWIWAVLGLMPNSANSEPSELPFRLGFSRDTFGDINENDAVASVRIWAQMILRNRGIQADPQPQIFQNVHDISAALANKTVDCVAMGTDKYVEVSGQLDEQHIAVAVVSGSIYEVFVLLVHRENSIERPGDLRGRKIALCMSQRTTLARLWLDMLLDQENLGPSNDFFGEIASTTKITKAVLPVFFRQTDACLVSRNGFETMVELNPQVGQQLKVLAVSPGYVPTAFFFRKGYASPIREEIMGEITRWHLDPIARQILRIFKVDRLEESTSTCLKSGMELVAAHKRLCSKIKQDVSNNVTGRAAGRRE